MNWKKIFAPTAEYYRDLRWNNLTSPKYRHLFLLLYWPFYGLCFLILERLLPLWTDITYHSIWCALDDSIPFCEFFTIPYYYWFVFLIGFGAYWLLFDVRLFKDWMWCIIIMYSATLVVYVVYPNQQELRPAEFLRDNLFTDIVKNLYEFDTKTNVCPSIHVLGSLATFFPGMHSKQFKGWGWKLFFILSTVTISVSTVFLKQHSIIDVFAACGVGLICYAILYWIRPFVLKKKGIPQCTFG